MESGCQPCRGLGLINGVNLRGHLGGISVAFCTKWGAITVGARYIVPLPCGIHNGEFASVGRICEEKILRDCTKTGKKGDQIFESHR